MNDIAHELSEFPNFPWEKLDENWFKSCAGYGTGGIIGGVNFNEGNRPHISFVNQDLDCDSWEIPRQLERLLEDFRSRGREEVKSEFRNLIAPKYRY